MGRVESSDPRSLAEWIERAKNTLGLAEWTVNVTWDSLPDDTFARIQTAYARKEATIILGKEYLASSPESQRETLVHELLHCHFAPLDEYVDDSLPTLLGGPTYKAFETAYDLLEERSIDAVAVAIANMGIIPVPPEEE